MSSETPKTAMNVVPLVLLAIVALAAVIYAIAFKEDEKSGIAEKDALDARQVEQVIENEPGKTPPVTHE